MESDLEEEMSKQAYLDKMRQNYIRVLEESSREKLDPAIYRNDGGAKKREEEAEMNMLRRRRERFMRHLRRRRKRQSKSEEEESFTSIDSDEEMNISVEEVKRLMENMNSTLKSKEEFLNSNNGDAVKIEEEEDEDEDEDENSFPRTRGRLVRYLRRQRSKPQHLSFQIEFHHLHLPSDDE